MVAPNLRGKDTNQGQTEHMPYKKPTPRQQPQGLHGHCPKIQSQLIHDKPASLNRDTNFICCQEMVTLPAKSVKTEKYLSVKIILIIKD